MRLMSWFLEKMSGPKRDIVREAIAATKDATNKARSLRQQLEPFRLETDPFAAIHRKQIMADVYESSQMASMHKGPMP